MKRYKSLGLSPLRLTVLLIALTPSLRAQTPPAISRPGGPVVLRADTVALLLSDQEGGAIRLGILPLPHPTALVTAGPTANPGPPPTLTVLVEIEGNTLMASHDQPILRAHAFVYVVGDQRETLALATHRLRLDLNRHRPLLSSSGLRWLVPLAPPPGRHLVRVYIRSEAGTSGLASATVDIPDPASTTDQLWPPLLATPENRWLTVVSEEDQAVLSKAWGWLGSDGLIGVAARPVFQPPDQQQMMMIQSVSTPSEDTSPPRARLERTDGAVRDIPFASLTAIDQVPEGLLAWRGSLATSELDLGHYQLAAQRGTLLSPSIPAFSIASDHPSDTWPGIGDDLLAPRIELPLTTAQAADTDAPLQDQEIIAGYLQALRFLSRGDRDAALRRLYKLESQVLSLFEDGAVEKVEGLEAETLSALLGGRESSLLPVILLHAQATRGYRAAGRSALVGHSEHMVLRLVQTWVERTSGEYTRRDAIRILTDLAAQLRRLGTIARAELVYQQALTIEPKNADVALALAAIREKRGQPAQAVAALEALSSSRLGDEARLRLAINYQRLGQRVKAEKHFRHLIQGSSAHWIRILAYEELVRISFARGNFEAAVRLLRQALQRWPKHPGLRVQQAYALDRMGRAEEAAQSLEEMASRGRATQVQERSRYHAWPTAQAEDGRQDMEQRALDLLPELGAALEALQQGQPAAIEK